MGAEPQEPFLDSGSEDAGKLEPSLSDVQLVEAFFEVEGRLEAALAAARHPAAEPQVAICVTAWIPGIWVVHRFPEMHVLPSLGGMSYNLTAKNPCSETCNSAAREALDSKA